MCLTSERDMNHFAGLVLLLALKSRVGFSGGVT